MTIIDLATLSSSSDDEDDDLSGSSDDIVMLEGLEAVKDRDRLRRRGVYGTDRSLSAGHFSLDTGWNGGSSSSSSISTHATKYEDCNGVDSCQSADEWEAKVMRFGERGKARRQRAPAYATSAASSADEIGGVDENQLLQDGYVTLDDLLDWGEAIAPVFASTLPTYLFEIFFPARPYPPIRTPFTVPRLQEPPPSSAFFSSASSPLLFALACLSSSLNGNYYRLFTSMSDGLSFNRLLNALLGFGGPTLLLIRDTDSNVFGAYTASPWKESKDFCGNSDCFLFAISSSSSRMAVYRPTGDSTNFQHCNSFARSKGYDQQAHGIGFGGSTQQPRLFLSEHLDEKCKASSQDLTFDNGSLLLNSPKGQSSFTVESLEVWAVGGDDVVEKCLEHLGPIRGIDSAPQKLSHNLAK